MTGKIGTKDGELMADWVLTDGSRPNTLAKIGKRCGESVSFWGNDRKYSTYQINGDCKHNIVESLGI